MAQVEVSNFTVFEEQDASAEVTEVFDDMKRTLGIPFVTALFKQTGMAPTVVQGTWSAFKTIFGGATLPASLATMILYNIAAVKNCQYCSTIHQATCRTLGVDEETLAALDGDLEALAPRRVQAIIKFAQKCALDPQSLVKADYDTVRDQGVSDEELMEIIGLAALGNFLDTLADAVKIDVDDVFKQPAAAPA